MKFKNPGTYWLLIGFLFTLTLEWIAYFKEYTIRPRIALCCCLFLFIALCIFLLFGWQHTKQRRKGFVLFLCFLLYVAIFVIASIFSFSYLTTLPSEKEIIKDGKSLLQIESMYEEKARYYEDYGFFFINIRED